MSPERWSEVEKLYHSAMELEPHERAAFLALCSDEELRMEVQSLLDHEETGDQVLENLRWRPNLAQGQSLSPGTSLGAYEVLGVIGAGGMGEVYKARDTRLGRNVALKFVSGEYERDEQAR